MFFYVFLCISRFQNSLVSCKANESHKLYHVSYYKSKKKKKDADSSSETFFIFSFIFLDKSILTEESNIFGPGQATLRDFYHLNRVQHTLLSGPNLRPKPSSKWTGSAHETLLIRLHVQLGTSRIGTSVRAILNLSF